RVRGHSLVAGHGAPTGLRGSHGVDFHRRPHVTVLLPCTEEATLRRTHTDHRSLENRTPPSGIRTPGQTRAPLSNSQPVPTEAPSARTTSRRTVPLSTRAPAPSTESVTSASSPTDAPSSNTGPCTRAPGDTRTRSPSVVPPVSRAPAATAEGGARYSPAVPGSAAVGAIPRTRSAEPRTYDSGVPTSRQEEVAEKTGPGAPRASSAGNGAAATR